MFELPAYYELLTETGQIWRFTQVKGGFHAFTKALDFFGNVYFRYEYFVTNIPGNCKIICRGENHA